METTAWIVVANIVKFQRNVIKLQDIASTAVKRDGVIPRVTQVSIFNISVCTALNKYQTLDITL